MNYILASFLSVTVLFSQGKEISDFFISYVDEPITILLTGDIMLGRYVETLMQRHGRKYPFEMVAPFMQSKDIVIGNLEGPIPNKHTQTKNGHMSFSFPEYVPDVLKDAGFTHVSLANNHAYDKGYKGYVDTITSLSKVGIESVGSSNNDEKCYLMIEKNNKTIGLVVFNDTWAKMSDDKILACMNNLSSTIDFTIVYIHWGDEYVSANTRQKMLARTFIDLGADTVIGHHPHVVQNQEWYKGKPIFYSLGNLIFDQYFSDEVQSGLIIEINIGYEDKYIIHEIKSKNSQPIITSSLSDYIIAVLGTK